MVTLDVVVVVTLLLFADANNWTKCFAIEEPIGPFPTTMYDDDEADGTADVTADVVYSTSPPWWRRAME